MTCWSVGVNGVLEYVVHCSIMWPAQAHVQSPTMSFFMMGQWWTFLSQSSCVGGAGGAFAVYLASCSVRESCLAGCLPNLTARPSERVYVTNILLYYILEHASSPSLLFRKKPTDSVAEIWRVMFVNDHSPERKGDAGKPSML